MNEQPPEQNAKKAANSADHKTSEPNKPIPQPDQGSPMGRFNAAMQKILSTPKKNLPKR
jgi:hypothetical protein